MEEVILRDGSVAIFRMVRAEDKALLLGGFERLSPQSRQLRFFALKQRLSEAEVRYLTEIDGNDHFAIGAVRKGVQGPEAGLAIGRFVRFPEEPAVAEPAITVVDDAQGQGLGTMLLRRLVVAARERGIEVFRCDVLAENETMQDILRDTSPEARFEPIGDGVLQVEMPLPPVDADGLPETRGTPHHAMLSSAAGDSVTVSERPRGIKRAIRLKVRRRRS